MRSLPFPIFVPDGETALLRNTKDVSQSPFLRGRGLPSEIRRGRFRYSCRLVVKAERPNIYLALKSPDDRVDMALYL